MVLPYLSDGERGRSDDSADEASRVQHQLQHEQPRQRHSEHLHTLYSEAKQGESKSGHCALFASPLHNGLVDVDYIPIHSGYSSANSLTDMP